MNIPTDPQGGVDNNGTGYFVSATNYRISLFAPQAETKTIQKGSFTCGDEVIFTYKGEIVTYGSMESPNTDKCFLDKNLGAIQVATAKNDHQAYGDLFQWGRLDDEHQSITWADATTGIPDSANTDSLSSSDDPGHSDFIITSSSPNDWRDPQNDDMWKEDGSGVNNPCPTNWRIPTSTEWDYEITEGSWSNDDDAYNDLKLTLSGGRACYGGSLTNVGSEGYYWSSSVDGSYGSYLVFGDFGISIPVTISNRANGNSVRCLRD